MLPIKYGAEGENRQLSIVDGVKMYGTFMYVQFSRGSYQVTFVGGYKENLKKKKVPHFSLANEGLKKRRQSKRSRKYQRGWVRQQQAGQLEDSGATVRPNLAGQEYQKPCRAIIPSPTCHQVDPCTWMGRRPYHLRAPN